MSKHTPAPWRVVKEWVDDGDGSEVEVFTVASAEDLICTGDVERHDAYLIAAAPELLEALERVTDCLTKALTGGEVSAAAAGKALIDASAAIAKARGEQP